MSKRKRKSWEGKDKKIGNKDRKLKNVQREKGNGGRHQLQLTQTAKCNASKLEEVCGRRKCRPPKT